MVFENCYPHSLCNPFFAMMEDSLIINYLLSDLFNRLKRKKIKHSHIYQRTIKHNPDIRTEFGLWM